MDEVSFSKKDANKVQKRYTERYDEFGYSAKTLGWNKGRQDIRFDLLTSHYDFNSKHILDIGCGFGDLNKTLSQKSNNYRYTGIDLVEVLIAEAKKRFNDAHIQFLQQNILEYEPESKFDYGIASGVFNYKLSEGMNYEFIEQVVEKTLDICDDGLAFDFLSDKVDYQLEHTFHSSPEKILSIAYKYSRNVVLRNDYMPFEFSVFIFKDDKFSKEDAVFNRYKSINGHI